MTKQEMLLSAPVTITMKASLNSTLDTPWCAYYNNETKKWEEDGLAIVTVSPREPSAEEGDDLEVYISCLSYHLSDFAVSTTDSDGIFAPVALVRWWSERPISPGPKSIVYQIQNEPEFIVFSYGRTRLDVYMLAPGNSPLA